MKATVETTAPVDPADTVVLFTITTTMASPKGVADFVEIVRSPRAMTKAELAALENGGCTGWPERITNPMVQEVAISSKLVSGAWPTDDEIFATAGAGTLYSGDWHGYQAACSTGIVQVPGTVSVLHLVGGDDPDGGPYGWATQRYGFGLVWDGAEPPDSGDPKVTSCAIELAPAAESASELAVRWPDSRQPDSQYACVFGGEL